MNIKFEKIAEDWLIYKKTTVKQSTYSNYYGVVMNRLMKTFEGTSLRNLTKYDYNRYISELMGNGLDNKTVKDTLIILKQMLKYAEARYNVRMNLEWIGTPRLKEKEIVVFTKKEYKKIKAKLIECKSTRYLGILLSLMAGLRIGEVCGLRWCDIDFNKKVINIKNIVVRVRTENGISKAILTEPKTKKSNRFIPMSDILCKKLKDMSKSYSQDAYIITGTTRYTEPISYGRVYKDFLEKQKIKIKKYHTLRHTFATLCISLGMPIKDLSIILGHASVVITLKFYVHPNLESSIKFLNQL